MSIKRSVLSAISGIALEVLALWGINRLTASGLFGRINWRSTFVWGFFFAGFFTAVWLHLWFKLTARLFGGKGKSTDAPATTVSQVQSPVAPTQTPMTPAQAPTTPVQSVNTPVQNTASTAPAQTPSAGPSTSPTTPTTPVVPARPMAPRMAPPVRMSVQNNAILSVNPTDPTTAVQTPMAAPVAPVAQPRAPSQKENDIVMLSDIDQELDMMAFKHVALEGKVIDLVYSSDDVAVLCKLFSDDHTWSVNTTQPIDACVWTNEIGETSQPCATLLAQVSALKKMEADAEIVPTIVMVRGSVQNFSQVADYLLQNKITLVQYENEKMSEAISLHDLLKEKFSLFPEDGEENQDASDEETSDLDNEDSEEPQQEGWDDGEENNVEENKVGF